jgi:hypothetical protein
MRSSNLLDQRRPCSQALKEEVLRTYELAQPIAAPEPILLTVAINSAAANCLQLCLGEQWNLIGALVWPP